MIALSQGPLTSKILAKMGHPYGRNLVGMMRGRLGISSRPAFRGQVTSALNQINISGNKTTSGNLAKGWHYTETITGNGVEMVWSNDAPESWFVMRGTRLMVAHGPGTYSIATHLGALDSAWRNIGTALYHRQRAMSQIMGSMPIPDRIPDVSSFVAEAA